MASIPEEFHDLFEKRTFAHVTTMLPDGAPHSTPVWIDYDEDAGNLLINSVEGRRKVKNAHNDERIAVSMTDPDDPYRMLSVTGTVAEITNDGAAEHIDELARRYMDVDEYPNESEGERVIVAVDPEDVNDYAG